MLQLAVWGIALMLAVKGFDVLHRQGVARSAGHQGATGLAAVTALVAFLSSAGLAYLASNVRPVPELGGLASYERHEPALEAGKRLCAEIASGEYQINEKSEGDRALKHICETSR